MEEHFCDYCYRPANFYGDDKARCGDCFHYDFWLEKLPIKDRTDVARIDGHHYMIDFDEKSKWKGFAGRKFVIQFKDGRKITTTNLWYQGEIPWEFRQQLPDNAVFLEMDA